MKPIKWTPEKIAVLVEEYPSKNTKLIAVKLGFTEAAVRSRAKFMGLHKDFEKRAEWQATAPKEPKCKEFDDLPYITKHRIK